MEMNNKPTLKDTPWRDNLHEWYQENKMK